MGNIVQFVRDDRGSVTLEYIALLALGAGFLYAALHGIFLGLQNRLVAFQNSL